MPPTRMPAVQRLDECLANARRQAASLENPASVEAWPAEAAYELEEIASLLDEALVHARKLYDLTPAQWQLDEAERRRTTTDFPRGKSVR